LRDKTFALVGRVAADDFDAGVQQGTVDEDLVLAQGEGVREIARRLSRSPSTISRELRRNAATRNGQLGYRASIVQWKAELAARRPKTPKLVANSHLHEYVQDRLAGQIQIPDGTPVAGPQTSRWKGRNRPPTAGPSVGDVVEPAADLAPAAGRLP
jgi:hypothetical protein